MPKPLVSILIPAYNAERWLAEALESALAQSWSRTEIIVVDDGSTDGTAAVAKRYASKTLQVVELENRGHCEARNAAFARAQGDHIQYLDADDLLAPTKVDTQLQILSDAPRHLAACATRYFMDGDPKDQGACPDLAWMVPFEDPFEFLIAQFGGKGRGFTTVPIMAWLLPRRVAEAIGPWDPEILVDADGEYFARAVAASEGVRVVPEALVYYRRYPQGGSVSSMRSARVFQSRLRAVQTKDGLVLGHANTLEARRAIAFLYQWLAVDAYPQYRDVAASCTRRLQELDVEVALPQLGGPAIERFAVLAGWKAARRLQLFIRQVKEWSGRVSERRGANGMRDAGTEETPRSDGT